MKILRLRQTSWARLWHLPLGLLVGTGLIAGCASMGDGPEGEPWIQTGEASWYGVKFDGRTTASGEIYDMHRLTAAHRTLPFGSIVEVTNLNNGERVRVRINDRGPFAHGRIIDLSYRAAVRIEMIGTGTAPVKLRLIHRGGSAEEADQDYTVQVGAFHERDHARSVLSRLKPTWPDAHIEREGDWHRVLVGRFKDRTEAERLLQKILAVGFVAIVKPVG